MKKDISGDQCVAAYIDYVLAGAPPLRPEQRAALGELLHPAYSQTERRDGDET